jgi:hypothetical protein
VGQLRDHVADLDALAADAGQGELRLGLGEPRGWSLRSEQQEPYGHPEHF